ncbi:MAG: hypothetical protein ACR2QE_14880 [Acidimicrobiales bacterium]
MVFTTPAAATVTSDPGAWSSGSVVVVDSEAFNSAGATEVVLLVVTVVVVVADSRAEVVDHDTCRLRSATTVARCVTALPSGSAKLNFTSLPAAADSAVHWKNGSTTRRFGSSFTVAKPSMSLSRALSTDKQITCRRVMTTGGDGRVVTSSHASSAALTSHSTSVNRVVAVDSVLVVDPVEVVASVVAGGAVVVAPSWANTAEAVTAIRATSAASSIATVSFCLVLMAPSFPSLVAG